jgi:glutathione synthase/RimK-type ligase-like ATP-grasp enzyme
VNYIGENTFTHAWKWQGKILQRINGPLTFDLIWNRGNFLGDEHCNIMNDPALGEITTDKWKSYLLLPEHHPKTVLLQSVRNVDSALRSLRGSWLVGKPIDRSGGEGVIIGPREKVIDQLEVFPYLLQEFIDSRHGIPGLVQEPYDLRIISLKGEISLCYIRTAPPGEFTANVSRGGKEIEVKPELIPEGACNLFYAVDAKFQKFANRMYCVDMALDRDGHWKIIELNSQPGFSPKFTGKSYPIFYRKLAELLLS